MGLGMTDAGLERANGDPRFDFGFVYGLIGALVGGATLVKFFSAALEIGVVGSLLQVLRYYDGIVGTVLAPINHTLPVQDWMHRLAGLLRGWRLGTYASFIDALQGVQALSFVCAGIGFRVVSGRFASLLDKALAAVLWFALGISGFATCYLATPLMWLVQSRFSPETVEQASFSRTSAEDHAANVAFARDYTVLLVLSAVAAVVFFGINQVLRGS